MWPFKKKEEWIEAEIPIYVWDAVIRFADHELTIEGAYSIRHTIRESWLIAFEGDEWKYINTALAEEVTVTRREDKPE